jgi:squalene cyclase
MRDDVVSEILLAALASRQVENGGWSSFLSSPQASLEATALAALALRPDSHRSHDRATSFLLRVQNPNGSWPAFLGDDRDGSWTTALCLLALSDLAEALPQKRRGLDWLIHSTGQESHWLWKWKFRTADRHVHFDPDKFGWPWMPHTTSWVVPSAFSILALRQLRSSGVDGASRRVQLGVEMILDRACPAGGWNAGNGVVYGTAMAPHPDDTAAALLALLRHRQEPIVLTSVDWLERITPTITAPWSLAWCILALAAYGRTVDPIRRRLVKWHKLDEAEDNSTLAVCSLALDHERALARLGVAA